MSGTTQATTATTAATASSASNSTATYGASQSSVYSNANIYMSNQTTKNTATTKKAARTGNMTFKNGKSNLEDFFIGKDATSASIRIEKDLKKIISDLEAIKNSYKKLANHKSTTGDFLEGANDGLKAVKGYRDSAEIVSSNMEKYMKSSCSEFIKSFENGSLKLKKDANDIGKGVSTNM